MSANPFGPLLLQPAETGTVPAQRAVTALSGRRIAGMRVTALLEIAAFLSVALVLDAVWGAHNRFAEVSPHPFWIVVVLAATYYGTHEGLAAVVLSSAALLLGHLPPQQIDEDLNTWLLRLTLQPLSWCIAALLLGSLKDSFRRRHEALGIELTETREQLQTITEAYDRLHQLKQHLEARVASQLCTVYAMYNASRAIERHGVGEVLVGVNGLVRSVMNPGKFSLFLLNGACLEATASEGWQADDAFARDIEASSPLFDAIVTHRRFLVVTHPADEPLLRGQGVLAGPIVNEETGTVVGMLKIEAIGFLDLHMANVQSFRVLCDWIGAALANAQRVENLLQSHCFGPTRHVQPQAFFDRQRDLISRLVACNGLAASILSLTVSGHAVDAADGRLARAVSTVAEQVLDATQLCCDHQCSGAAYSMLLPGAGPGRAQEIAAEFEARLAIELAAMGLHGSIRIEVAPLGADAP